MTRTPQPAPTHAPVHTGPTDRSGIKLRGTTSQIVTVRFFDGRLIAVPIRHDTQRHHL